jgi:hypothetical protein
MVVVGVNAREDIPRMESWASMTNSWETQLEGKTSLMGLAMKKNPMAIRMMRPQEGDGVQDDQQGEEEAAEHEEAAQESSGVAGKGPFSPDLKERVRQLEKQLADLVAVKINSGSSF